MMTCALLCSAGETCYATSSDAMDCLNSIPFNRGWANATIDVVSQSLENFGFKALYHSTGPPYSINLDIMGELAGTQDLIDADSFANDLAFQEHVQNIFQLTLDAHTRYRKPACYNANFVQPFAFDMQVVPGSEPDNGSSQNPAVTSMDSEPRLFVMENLYSEQYAAQYPGFDIQALIGQEIVLLDGLEATTAIAQWGDSHETRSNNAGARFNSAVRSFLSRSAMQTSVVPLQDLALTLADGSEVTLPWLASYTDGLADVSVCAAAPAITASEQPRAPLPRAHPSHVLLADPHPPALLVPEVLHAERADRQVVVPSDSPYYLSCFVQTLPASSSNASQAAVSRVLVMKVASFSPPGLDYTDAWTQFLASAETCLSQQFDLVVVSEWLPPAALLLAAE
jgi:hypothetical protein